jgi:rhodanese-related sulfurtransferase
MSMPQTGSLTFIGAATASRDIGPTFATIDKTLGRSYLGMAEELTAAEVAAKVKADPQAVVLLDVREPFERELAHIEPSIHIPMRDVPSRIAEIPKDREVIVYCHGGTRSAMIVGFLEAHGYTRLANMAGGIDAWSRTVDPKVPRYD